jgi:hypothetical protein
VHELGYWCTSYREAAGYLIAYAAEDEIIVVAGPEYGVRNFIREDLQVVADWQGVKDADYSVACEHALIYVSTIKRH